MKVKDIISQLEKNMGRQPEGYLMRLINDGLLDIAAERQHKIDDMKDEYHKKMLLKYDIEKIKFLTNEF